MSRTRTHVLVLLVFVLMLFVGGVSARAYFTAAVTNDRELPAAMFLVAEDTTISDLKNKLIDEQWVKPGWVFSLYLRASNRHNASVTSGEYRFSGRQSMSDIYTGLVSGTARTKTEVTVTIPEGFTVEKIAERLDAAGVTTVEQFTAAVDRQRSAMRDRLGELSTDTEVEGIFFPDTYNFFPNTSGDDVVRRMLQTYDRKLSDLVEQAAQKQKLTRLQVLTLASILEKEVRTYEERRLAADLFMRRVREGWKIESDATVNYITGKGALRPTFADIAVDSRYNTYKYGGYPPGPINNPGALSVRAILEAKPNDFYFFITDSDGIAHFGKNFAEHRANIRKYLD